MGLRNFLLTSKHIIPETQNDVILLKYYDRSDILKALAFDINRLSCASIETVLNVNYTTTNPKFLAWKLIQYYYSAFFSAHSIIKILGFGLVQLDSNILSYLKKIANLYGYAFSASKGIYCLDFLNNETVALYKVKRYDDSHKGLWTRFLDLLNVLVGKSIKTGHLDNNCIALRNSSSTPDSVFSKLSQHDTTLLILKIDELKSFLNSRGNNGLSAIRNLLNYNHEFGVWYPYKGHQKNYSNINSYNGYCFNYSLNACFEKCGTELNNFVKYCQQINAINFEILDDLLVRHPENKSFLKSGFFAYKRKYHNSN